MRDHNHARHKVIPLIESLAISRAYAVIRSHPWIPAIATVASALALLVIVMAAPSVLTILGLVGILLFTSYLCGYCVHVSKQTLWPPLSQFRRREYAKVWDSLALSPLDAAKAAVGDKDKDAFCVSGKERVHDLLEFARVGTLDEVLEIGCGVGRIGLALAPYCRHWTGADISANMLAQASHLLGGVNNIRLVQLQGVGLSEVAANSFDVVYCTNVFAHLDEIDRWRYVEEACRVLRPGGRLYIDNIDLESDEGWGIFMTDAKRYQDLERPPYMPRLSTAAELSTYARRAGFAQVEVHHRPPLAIVIAVKTTLGKA